MAAPQAQVISMQPSLAGGLKRFPSDLRSKPLSRFETRFSLLFIVSLLVIGGFVFFLSLRKLPDTVSEKQILKIQERYASIVLNQPKPVEQIKPKEVKPAPGAGKEEAAEQKKEEQKIDREKESFSAKQERKAGTQAQRQAERAKVAQQVQSTGIFAAITSVGAGSASSFDGASPVNDLLSAGSEGMGNLGDLRVSKGTFATKNVDVAEVKARRGQITSGVDIARQSVGKISGGKIAAAGNVNITSAAPEVSGEAASLASRSQSSIKQQIDLEANRLKRVYENWLKRDPSLAGQLKIKFTILPSGEVANVSVVNSTTNNSEFDDNIVRYVKRWMFSAIEGGGPVEVIYPFVFSSQS